DLDTPRLYVTFDTIPTRGWSYSTEVAMTHLPRYGPTGRWLVATSLLAVAACSTDRNLTAPRNRPELAISDGAHQGGTPGFFFLPPLVAQPGTGGAFDADIAALSPQVAICDITL